MKTAKPVATLVVPAAGIELPASTGEHLDTAVDEITIYALPLFAGARALAQQTRFRAPDDQKARARAIDDISVALRTVEQIRDRADQMRIGKIEFDFLGLLNLHDRADGQAKIAVAVLDSTEARDELVNALYAVDLLALARKSLERAIASIHKAECTREAREAA